MLYIVIALLYGYAWGSIPTGPIVAYFFKLGDLRKIGSGNIGATNVLRTGNKLAAFLTLLGDGLKAFIAIITFDFGWDFDPSLIYFTALGAFLGHLYPIWLKFKGGKGVATFLGIHFGLVGLFGIVPCLVWLGAVKYSKISSVGAITMALTTPFFYFFVLQEVEATLMLLPIVFLVLFKHKENIKRLMEGTEPKVGN